MKKLLSLILALTMMLTLAACGSNAAVSGNDAAGNSAVQEQQKPDESQKPTESETEQKSEEAQPAETDTEQGSEEEQPTETEKPAEGEKEEETESEEETPAITASHSDVTLTFVGHSFKLAANGVSGSASVTYTSADETIAAVAEDGTVTAAGMGATRITMRVEQDGAVQDFTCIVRCKWTEETVPETDKDGDDVASFTVDLAKYYSDFIVSLGADNTPAMVELNAELIDAYYTGLNEVDLNQSVVQMAAMMQVAFEFALVECADAADAETVRNIFQTRIDNQISGGAFYPAIVEAWESAEVVVNGSFVALIVAGDQQENAVAAFEAMFA